MDNIHKYMNLVAKAIDKKAEREVAAAEASETLCRKTLQEIAWKCCKLQEITESVKAYKYHDGDNTHNERTLPSFGK